MPTSTFYNLALERRLLIATVALEEFSKHPLHEASVAVIIERLSIARGTFYKYFTDLKELYFYLYCETHLREDALLAQVLHSKKKQSKAYEMYFDTLLEELFDELHAYRRMVRLSMYPLLSSEMTAYCQGESNGLALEPEAEVLRSLTNQVLVQGLARGMTKHEIKLLFQKTWQACQKK